jgi:phosphohistidine phosphatase
MSMLYFCRHAIAEEARAGQADEARELTAEGIRKFRRAAPGIVKLVRDAPPQVILTSPLIRARQTADLLVDAFNASKLKVELAVAPDLAPGGRLSGLLKLIGEREAMAVGHEPQLSEWVADLCFHGTGGMGLEMKKGAVAAVEVRSARSAKLLFLAPPSVLRRL